MKKLLMLGAILVLGATAFAKDANIDGKANEAEGTVTVKAKLVAKNLVISDLEGNPIVLDFKEVSKTQETGTREVSEGYLVKYVGTDANSLTDGNNTLKMSLKGATGFVDSAVPVTLSSLTQVNGEKADSFDVNVGLDSYTGKMPLTVENGNDYRQYQGTIYATLDFAAANPQNNGKAAKLSELDSGDYQGQTVLKVTINDGNPLA